MNQKFHNVVIGTPLISPDQLLAFNLKDWEENEKSITLFTNIDFLPKLLVECGVVSSISEVRRNKPELVKFLIDLDYLEIKWGKKKIFVIVGEHNINS